MNLAELNKVAEAMVAPGRGILAADESSGTIKKRFDNIGVENTEDNRRDYREMMFRTNEAMSKYVSGVILYDETIRQKAKDGTPLVKIIEQAGALPGIKVDKGTKPLPFCPGETITEGLDGLRERLVEYRNLGAKFAKWRAVIDIGAGIPSYTAIKANAHALARYAALCQEEEIVPIVEPEVLMDGDHDADRCYTVSEWVLKTTFEELYYSRVALEGIVLKPNMAVAGKKAGKARRHRGSRRQDRAAAEGLRAGHGARYRVPLGRPVGRGGDRPSRRHEQARAAALEADLLLRPRPAGRPAEGLERQNRERRRRAARLHAPRADELAARRSASGSRTWKRRRLNLFPAFWAAMNDHRRHSAEKAYHAVGMGSAKARLYLVTPPLGDAGAIADDLAHALNATDIAAVLLRLEPRRRSRADRADRGVAHPDPEQRRGAAARRPSGVGCADAGRRRAPERHRRVQGGSSRTEAEIHRGLRRAHEQARRHDRGRVRRGLRHVRRAGSRRTTPALRGRTGTRRLVGRCADGTVRRLMPASLDEVEALARTGADFVAVGEDLWRNAATFAAVMQRLAVAGAGAMMRRLLLCGVAAAAMLAADAVRAQAPMQITPPSIRPPASIPAKPAPKPKAAPSARG